LADNNTAIATRKNLFQMTLEELKQQDAGSLAVALRGAIQSKVAILGDGQVFLRRTSDGVLRSVAARLTLEHSSKHICKINHGYMIQAEGMYFMNQVAGLNVITPPFLMMPSGEKRPNPYVATNTNNISGQRITEGVWVRKVVFGYGPTGTPCATDETLYFDLHTYFLQDMVNKGEKYPEAIKIKMTGALTEEEKSNSLILPYMYGIVVVADVSHPEVRGVISTQIQKMKFAERNAVTICERRALGRHPAIGRTKVQGVGGDNYGNGATASVTVYGWRHDKSKREIEEMALAASEGQSVGGTEILANASEAGDEPSDIIDMEEVHAEGAADAPRQAPTQPGASDGEPDDEPTHAEKSVAYFLDQQTTVNGKRKVLIDNYGEEAVHAAIDEIPALWKDMTPKEKAKTLDVAAKALAKNAAAQGGDK